MRPDAPGPAATAREQLEADLHQLPRYYSVKDLVTVLGGGVRGVDRLVDAYCQGWLPEAATAALEDRPETLQCWLLARVIRLQLAAGAHVR